MKLKYEFIICSTKDAEVAFAVGEGSMLFNGMIKLNKSGKFIFELLMRGNISIEDIAIALKNEYNIDLDTALQEAEEFAKELRANDLLEE